MNNKEINEFKTNAVIALSERRILDTIKLVRSLPPAVLSYDIRGALDSVEEHYRLMLEYFARGASDPGRESAHAAILTDLRGVVDRCVRALQAEATPSQYFNVVRTVAVHPSRTVADVLAEYADVRAQLAATFDVAGIDTATDRMRADERRLARELFERTWTEYPLGKLSYTAIADAVGPDGTLSHDMRMRVLAAIGLGLLEVYDAHRFHLLADILDYTSDEKEALAAMVWLLTALFRYRSRKHSDEVEARLTAAMDHPLWHARVRAANRALLQSRDTERVVRRMRDELMPDIMRLSEDILDKKTREELLGDIMADAEANPEWEEKLRSSGMYDRMRELSEMTGDGADVFMGAFAHLKSMPFFSSIDAWFTPFDESQADVAEALGGDMAQFVQMLCRMPMPCDSDKFSMLFALRSGPAAQREALAMQLGENSAMLEQLSEMRSTSESDTDLAARSYAQNLYRFFKLYPRHNEFFDPFARQIMPTSLSIAGRQIADSDTLRESAELLFKIGAWSDARAAIEAVASTEGNASAELYQKSGYCSEQLGEYNTAIESYTLADLYDDASPWTLRRLAASLRRTGNPERAIEPLRRLCRLRPDDKAARLNLAFSLIESREYAEASRLLQELEAESDDTRRLWRAQAWTAFMTDDYARARRYYDMVRSDNPSARDFLNMGHLAWVERRLPDAIEAYRQAMLADSLTAEQLRGRITEDFPAIVPKGIRRSELPLLLDAIQMA